MSRSKRIKIIVLAILVVVLLVSIIFGIVKSVSKDERKGTSTRHNNIVSNNYTYDIEGTKQYTCRRIKFNLPEEFKEKRVDNNVYKYTLSTKDEEATLVVSFKHSKNSPKQVLMDEFGFDEKDNFKDKKINKVVWLKVKNKNTYGYALKQRGTVYAIRYSYSKSKKIAKSVPSMLEKTMYLRVYYDEGKAK